MILRPEGIIRRGQLQLGLEVELDQGRIVRIGPHSGMPDPYVLSAAFVNAHSHLEYRSLMGRVGGSGFFEWIRNITRAKAEQGEEEVRESCRLAARENRAAGVAFIGEHSDRPFSREAMDEAGLEGLIFQEVITFLEQESPGEKLALVQEKAEGQRGVPSPHAPYTVDRATLEHLAKQPGRLSIHACESQAEVDFFVSGNGPFADMYAKAGFSPPATGMTPIEYLAEVGLLSDRLQLVHACVLSESDIDLIAGSGASVAHCPRSNIALDCPPAPVRRLRERGVAVGLGLDSAASSGPIDMFAEMRAAMEVSGHRVSAEDVWQMAVEEGAESLDLAGWPIEEGSTVPLIKVAVSGAQSTDDVLAQAEPRLVEWVDSGRPRAAQKAD